MRPKPRPRPESVRSWPRSRPKKLCEAEANAYEAEAWDEATVCNESCNIINFISHIIYHKTDISQTELT